MLKSIGFYVGEHGENPVKEFIEELSIKEQAKVYAYLEELKIQGHNLRRPMSDYLGDGIYELRPRDNRFFYFFFLRDNVVLIHAIRKRTNKIPVADLRICLKRRKEVEVVANIEKLDL